MLAVHLGIRRSRQKERDLGVVRDRGKSIDNRTRVPAQWEAVLYERDNRVRAVSHGALLFIMERFS
ncbi:MAG: hypothetical protein K0R47_320 [Brevibacillus sp.]|nr:hypothetical protein [Brevibacillus sp.]